MSDADKTAASHPVVTQIQVEIVCKQLGFDPWDWSNLRRVEDALTEIGLNVDKPKKAP